MMFGVYLGLRFDEEGRVSSEHARRPGIKDMGTIVQQEWQYDFPLV